MLVDMTTCPGPHQYLWRGGYNEGAEVKKITQPMAPQKWRGNTAKLQGKKNLASAQT